MATVNVHRVEHTRYLRGLKVKGATSIKKGEIVLSQDADGLCITGAVVANCKAVGVATEDKDNTAGADGALLIDVEQGVFLFDNHATNAITNVDVAKKGTAYCEDYQTVGNASAGKSPVGPIVGLNWDNGSTSLQGVQVRIES